MPQGEKATEAERLGLACLVCEHVWGDARFAQAARDLYSGGGEAT
jgi:hypothetical protein